MNPYQKIVADCHDWTTNGGGITAAATDCLWLANRLTRDAASIPDMTDADIKRCLDAAWDAQFRADTGTEADLLCQWANDLLAEKSRREAAA